jgi:hypothetical protein
MSWNKIAYIKHEIFKNNLRLEYIDLCGNYIEMINPKLFTSLNHLHKVGINDMTLSAADAKHMNGSLSVYYINFLQEPVILTREEIDQMKNQNVMLQNQLNFVRKKYKLCIQELENKDYSLNSNLNPNVSELKAAEVIKQNYDIIRNSHADVTLELADNQILEAHRHILEGEFYIF